MAITKAHFAKISKIRKWNFFFERPQGLSLVHHSRKPYKFIYSISSSMLNRWLSKKWRIFFCIFVWVWVKRTNKNFFFKYNLEREKKMKKKSIMQIRNENRGRKLKLSLHELTIHNICNNMQMIMLIYFIFFVWFIYIFK